MVEGKALRGNCFGIGQPGTQDKRTMCSKVRPRDPRLPLPATPLVTDDPSAKRLRRSALPAYSVVTIGVVASPQPGWQCRCAPWRRAPGRKACR